MSTSAFEPGAVFEIDGLTHQLVRKIEGDVWQAEDSRTRRVVEFKDRELRTLYVEGHLKFGSKSVPIISESKKKLLVDPAPEQWGKAKIRRTYVMAILLVPNNRVLLNPIIQETWEKLRQPKRPPDAATVMRWKAKFLSAGRDITVLIEQNERKGNVKSRYPREVEEIAKELLTRGI
jgi:putative transposase